MVKEENLHKSAWLIWLIIAIGGSMLLCCCCCTICCLCRKNRRRRRGASDKLFKDRVYKSSNIPNPRREKLKILKYISPTAEGTIHLVKELGAWLRIYCPCTFNFTKSVTLSEAIRRYHEYPPESTEELTKNLRENIYIHFILTYINTQLPKFYFKILPSGSLRERFGSKLPSTSILATDYDLMLVPDGIYVYDKETKHERDFPAAFTAIDNPNENPKTPQGFLWLLLQQHSLTEWNLLCYERLMQNGVELLLSQLAATEKIREIIGTPSFLSALKFVVCPSDTAAEKYSVKAERSGPALTIIVDKGAKEIFHADFTLAISCPVYPQCAKDFFERRNSGATIYWPNDEIVLKIESLGCHVVPKPSTKQLVQYETEQSEQSYLNQGAVLEWRYSFSQAEMILADEMPEVARTVFLAFKAVIKTHINNAVNSSKYKFHEISSYVLKTILFYEVERTPEEFWKEDQVECKFFNRLMDVLYKCMETQRCDHYWIPKINLLVDKFPEDFQFFLERLNAIRGNYVIHLTSDWLEFQRCIRFHCCNCCMSEGRDLKQITGLQKRTKIEDGTYCCVCCKCMFSYDSNAWRWKVKRWPWKALWNCRCKRRYGPIEYDPELFEVY